jgi:hypothetical protein
MSPIANRSGMLAAILLIVAVPLWKAERVRSPAAATPTSAPAATIASGLAGHLMEGSPDPQAYSGTFPASMFWAARVALSTASAPPPRSACGWAASPPATYQHVIWIWFENKSLSSVIGSANAPYMTSLAKSACAYGTSWLDNVLNSPSEPNYVAATSGSNCDSNTLNTSTPAGDRCVTTDGAPAASCSDVTCAGTVATSSIFEQLQNVSKSWRAYQEGMRGTCSIAPPSGRYHVKHNPPPFFSHLRIAGQFGGNTCSVDDIPFPTTPCDGTGCTPAASPNALADDLTNDTLPAFAFVTPDICDDMHYTCSPYNSSVKNGDDWLAAWMPRILASPAYQAGSTAVLVMWDEGTFGAAQPNIVVAPSVVPGTVVGATANSVAALRATEDMLGLDHLGCATGVQGDGSPCPAGSTADLRALFNL